MIANESEARALLRIPGRDGRVAAAETAFPSTTYSIKFLATQFLEAVWTQTILVFFQDQKGNLPH